MDRKLRLSIIVPAKNEERVLPRLLTALEAQTLRPSEVIVADAESTDLTREVALSHGCIVVPGGMPGVGRNNGASVSTGDVLVFLDSDVFVEPQFLEGLEHEIRTRRLDCGTVYNIPRYVPGDKGYHHRAVRLFDGVVYFGYNLGLHLSALIRYPYATGTCMFLSRGLFRLVGGFDERIVSFEDSDLAARAAKVGKHGVVKRPVVHISTRRFDKHDRLLWVVYLVLHGFVGRAVVGDMSHGSYFDKRLVPIPRLPRARVTA